MTEIGVDLLVQLDDPRVVEVREAAVPDPRSRIRDGEAVLRVQRFALTANNVTYAATGFELGYWQFYPGPPGWGRVPVWGFAEVVATATESLALGDRLYGFWPMSSHAVLTPAERRGSRLFDATPHRTGLPSLYNAYLTAGPEDPAREEVESLLRPLFGTAWLIADALAQQQFRGAATILISSASSKTATATAFCLSQLPDRPAIIGCTSATNVEFVRGLGTYDDVLSYDELPATLATPVAFVDIAGSARLRNSIHAQFGSMLVWSMIVGGTHWHDPAGFTGDTQLEGPAPELFFAPTQLGTRTRELGKQALFDAMGSAQASFTALYARSARIRRAQNPDDVAAVWRELVEGAVDARIGVVGSL